MTSPKDVVANLGGRGSRRAERLLDWKFVLKWLLLLIGGFCFVFSGSSSSGQDVDPLKYKPSWKVGQKWTIETVGHQSQARRDVNTVTSGKPIRWQFEVREMEEIEGCECYRVSVKCLVAGKRPEIVFWVDRSSMTLRRVQVDLPTPTGLQVMTESYRSDSGQPFPAFPPLSVPPLELPLFLDGAKGTQTFAYSAATEPGGIKAVGEIGFAFVVEQIARPVSQEETRELAHQAYAKSLVKQPTLEVRLKSAQQRVRQLWQPGSPWPVYSSNGLTESRLIQVVEPGKD